MNILIIGASGRIGFFIAKYFNNLSEINCYAVVRNFPAYCLNKQNNIKVFLHDFSSTKNISDEICNIDYDIVINCAYDIKSPSEILRNNYLILENISKLNVKTLINLSSISVYGKSLFDLKNNNRVLPDTFYSKLKFKLEKFAVKICKQKKINLINLRLGNVYGEGQLWSDIIDDLIESNNKIKLYENGNYFSNCINIKTICNALESFIKLSHNYNGTNYFNFVDQHNNKWSQILALHKKNKDFLIINLDKHDHNSFKKDFNKKYNLSNIIIKKLRVFISILTKDEVIKDKLFNLFSKFSYPVDKKIMLSKRINKIKNISFEKVIDEPVFYYKDLNENNFLTFIEKMKSN